MVHRMFLVSCTVATQMAPSLTVLMSWFVAMIFVVSLTTPKSLLPITLQLNKPDLYKTYTNADMCNSLALSPKQRRQCLRDDAMGFVLNEAMQRSLYACRYWFRSERWNCSLGSFRLNVLNKGNHEWFRAECWDCSLGSFRLNVLNKGNRYWFRSERCNCSLGSLRMNALKKGNHDWFGTGVTGLIWLAVRYVSMT